MIRWKLHGSRLAAVLSSIGEGQRRGVGWLDVGKSFGLDHCTRLYTHTHTHTASSSASDPLRVKSIRWGGMFSRASFCWYSSAGSLKLNEKEKKKTAATNTDKRKRQGWNPEQARTTRWWWRQQRRRPMARTYSTVGAVWRRLLRSMTFSIFCRSSRYGVPPGSYQQQGSRAPLSITDNTVPALASMPSSEQRGIFDAPPQPLMCSHLTNLPSAIANFYHGCDHGCHQVRPRDATGPSRLRQRLHRIRSTPVPAAAKYQEATQDPGQEPSQASLQRRCFSIAIGTES